MTDQLGGLTGKVCVVTGANTGIGKEIARELAQRDARVLLACRSEARGAAARDELIADTNNDALELMLVDLASQRSIRDFAARFNAAHSRLDVLVNNAGIWPKEKLLSEDGLELTFATNVLGYHLLTKLLLGVLRASAPSRIVNMASTFAGGLDLDDLFFERRRFSGAEAYKQSKQANRMLSWKLAQALKSSGVTVNVAHPGPVNSELARDLGGPLGLLTRSFFRVLGKSTADGADTASWLAYSPQVEGLSGRFWANRKQRRRRFDDPRAIDRLAQRCDALVR